jgi:hypothetical protein
MVKEVKKKTEIILEKQKKYSGDKLRLIPGISEAIDLIREHAFTRAIFEAIDVGTNGELGDKARDVISKDTAGATDDFLGLKIVESYIDDAYDGWLELFAFKAGPKIAELWGLSETAGQRLAVLIYWGEQVLTLGEAALFPLVLLVNAKDDHDTEILERHEREFGDRSSIVISPNKIQKGHIYLDVTELTYSKFRSAYSAIDLCREYLCIKKKDLKAGAPNKIDTQKALDALYLKYSHKSSKDIAKQLGFKVYSVDNPSGSYPLLHKYLKIGKDLEERLYKLDKFLSSITIKNGNQE